MTSSCEGGDRRHTKTWGVLESDLSTDLGGEELPGENEHLTHLQQVSLIITTPLERERER